MNYSIIKELGRGGMATVYLAEDKKFQTHVALKILNKDLANNDNIRKRFLSEARNMFKMSHPNIIKVTDLVDEDQTVAFVMEHIDGETLKEYMDRKGKLNENEIRNIFTQMLDALRYVHEMGLVHRDIKPSNFMIDRKGVVKLLDFGIAKNTDQNSAEYTQTGTGMQMGTPMYMSPEQITETKSVTAQSDLYSLGVVLWQLVTGEKPYNTATLSNFQLQLKIVNEVLPLTGSNFDAIIKKATQKDTSNRFNSAVDFLSAFQNKAIDNDKTVVAQQPLVNQITNNPTVTSGLKKPLPNSTTVLVLGILSIIFFFFFFLGIILAIISIALSTKGRKLQRENPNAYAGFGNLMAGFILSIITLSIGVIILLVVLISAGAFAS